MQNNSRKPSYSDVMRGDYSLKHNKIILQNNPQNIPPYQQIHQLNREILSNRVFDLVKGLQFYLKIKWKLSNKRNFCFQANKCPNLQFLNFKLIN